MVDRSDTAPKTVHGPEPFLYFPGAGLPEIGNGTGPTPRVPLRARLRDFFRRRRS